MYCMNEIVADNNRITFIIANNSCDKVGTFKYPRKTLTDENRTHEKFKYRLKKEIYIIIQSKFLCSLTSKKLKIKIYKTILLFVLYGCELWSLIYFEGKSLKSTS